MKDSALLARFDGPIVMIGFGSIGKGTLPLIERHLAFDHEKFVVIAPDDTDRELLDVRQIRFLHLAITRDNYREVLKPLLTIGPGRGMIVNLSVDTSSVDLRNFARISMRSTSIPSSSHGPGFIWTARARFRNGRTMPCARACSTCVAAAQVGLPR